MISRSDHGLCDHCRSRESALALFHAFPRDHMPVALCDNCLARALEVCTPFKWVAQLHSKWRFHREHLRNLKERRKPSDRPQPSDAARRAEKDA